MEEVDADEDGSGMPSSTGRLVSVCVDPGQVSSEMVSKGTKTEARQSMRTSKS